MPCSPSSAITIYYHVHAMKFMTKLCHAPQQASPILHPQHLGVMELLITELKTEEPKRAAGGALYLKAQLHFKSTENRTKPKIQSSKLLKNMQTSEVGAFKRINQEIHNSTSALLQKRCCACSLQLSPPATRRSWGHLDRELPAKELWM